MSLLHTVRKIITNGNNWKAMTTIAGGTTLKTITIAPEWTVGVLTKAHHLLASQYNAKLINTVTDPLGDSVDYGYRIEKDGDTATPEISLYAHYAVGVKLTARNPAGNNFLKDIEKPLSDAFGLPSPPGRER